MKNKKAFIALLSVFAISGGLGAIMTSGCAGSIKRIDAPTELEADLGTYVIPDYDVVDNDGMILAGYNVYLKSVKDADGEELAESYGSAVTVEEAGIYSFVYSAGTKNVKDVTVSIDFADRTAPTINCDDSTIPKFFIQGNSYKVPSYTLSGDFVREKCWAKVFYIDGANTETEVRVESGRFKVDKASGNYEIRIHVEDAAGNANDYKYARKVDGPENIVENKVLYFDEQFGERQVSCYQSEYTGGFVSKDEEGAKVYENENGSYKVSFNGETPTQYNEGLVVMDVPAIIDINEYENLYMYVYNDSEKDIIMGSQWWNDTKVEKGKWTRLTWNTRAWGYNMSANNTKQIGLVDITGMTIRFVFDYDQKVIPNGDFYLSAMYATPKVRTELESGENVTLNSAKYFVNDLVELNAVQIEGKTVDYYKVDGEIIPGNNFIATDTKHKIEVVYKDGELTGDNMTWARPEEFEVEGDDNQWQTMGISDYFAYTFDIYGAGDGWCYAGVQVGGNGQLLGFEISDAANSKFSGYGGSWKWLDGVKLTQAQYDAIRGATEQDPVKAVLVRRGVEIRAYLVYGGKTEFIASVNNTELGISENRYGYGQRNGPVNISHNVAAVGGETKTLLYFENNFNATLEVDGNAAEGKYYLGDSIGLTPAPAPENKMFAYFKVNGERIEGSRIVLTERETSVETVYTDIATIILADGIKTSDGKTGTVQVAKDTYVVLNFIGTTPTGKYYIGFTVDGVEFVGDKIYVSADSHEINVLFGNKIETGADKLNDITDDVLYAKDDDENKKWAPASVEHVTDFRFNGADGAVDENSVIKIVTGSDDGENSFAFDNSLVNNLNSYKEIYFYVYTEASGIKAGGWWCGDTVIVPEKWTKVAFDRNLMPGTIDGNGETKVWEEGIEKFAFRIFAAPAGTTVYVTAVYGLPYPDATVKIAEDSKQSLTVSAPANGTQYKEGETVTLTAAAAPEGKAFAYFTADGNPINGNKYVLETGEVTFGVVYSEISVVTLGEGVTVEGSANGKITVGRGANVTLVLDGEATPANKVFDRFEVDGNPLSGNTFTTTAATHSVTAVFIDKAADMTWREATTDGKKEANAGESIFVKKFGNADKWVMNYKVTDLSSGDWGSLLGVYIGGTSQILQISFSGSTYTATVYGQVYDTPIALNNIDLVNMIKNASAENPVDVTFVRSESNIVIYVTDKNNVTYLLVNVNISKYLNSGNATNDFGYADRNTHYGNPVIDIKYVTGEGKTGLFADSLKADISFEKAHAEQSVYHLGDTVTLTADAAETGKKFLRFTVNGEPITGDTFTVKSTERYKVVAEYSDISTLMLGDGVKTADGNTEFARGAKVALSFDEAKLGGKVVDYYLIDKNTSNEQKVYNGEFTTSAATHTVEAVLADVDNLTWTDFAAENVTDYEGWVSFFKTGAIAEDWIIEYKVTENVATGSSLGVYLGSDHWAEIELGYEKNILHGHVGGSDYWTKVADLPEDVVTKLQSAKTANVTLTWIRKGNTLTVVFDNSLYIGKFNFGDAHTGEKEFGTMFRGSATKDMFGDIKFIVGESRVFAYSDYIISNLINGQSSETQINNIYNAQVHEGTATLAFVTEIPGTLPAGVKEKGVIKAEFSDGGSTSLTVKNSFTDDISNYDEVYFYVYVDSANFADGMQAGTYWCCDTNLVSDSWVKVTVHRNASENPPAYNYDADSSLGGKFFAGDGSGFIFRLMGCTGKAVYVTSLYGVPKDVEPVVQNGVTNYSLISGDGELTAIVNDGFFPDAE